MCILGRTYSAGEGVPVDKAKSLEWYERAAQGGNARSLANLTVLSKAFESIRYRSAADRMVDLTDAAIRGDAWACVMLGDAYAKSLHGLPEDKVRAKRWYKKALACTKVQPDEDDRKAASDWLQANADVEDKWKC